MRRDDDQGFSRRAVAVTAALALAAALPALAGERAPEEAVKRAADPELAVEPASLLGIVKPGPAASSGRSSREAAELTLTVRNAGGRTLAWSVLSAPEWVRLDVASGELAFAGERKLIVTVEPETVPEGGLDGVITIVALEAKGSPAKIPVRAEAYRAAGEDEEEKKKEKWSPPRFTARRAEREAMVRVIRAYGLTDPAVLKAVREVPRHEFMPAKHLRRAYADTPLSIGYGQTISQPYIVAEMTRRLGLTPESRVLEIGTGSGYQAAVLTEFTPHVYTIEIVEPLAESAKERLSRLGYDVAKTRHADGYHGWPEEAPFDAIIVTCAAGQIPPPLIEQLRPGGRMVIPVGGRFAVQWLMLIEKDTDGTLRSRSLMGVRFVPFVRPPSRGGTGAE